MFPVALGTLILVYVGLGKAKLEHLPARSAFRPLPQAISALFWGLCLAGFAAIIIELTTGEWDEVVRFNGNWGKGPRYSSHIDRAWPSFTIILVGGAAMYVLMMILKRGHDRYWQLERVSRGVLCAAFALLITSSTIWLLRDMHLLRGFDNDAVRSADFAAWTCLVWAMGCRTRLLFRLRKHEKLKNQHDLENPECFACGYNLRGSVMAGSKRCPECGVSISRELLKRAEEAADDPPAHGA